MLTCLECPAEGGKGTQCTKKSVKPHREIDTPHGKYEFGRKARLQTIFYWIAFCFFFIPDDFFCFSPKDWFLGLLAMPYSTVVNAFVWVMLCLCVSECPLLPVAVCLHSARVHACLLWPLALPLLQSKELHGKTEGNSSARNPWQVKI